MTKRRSFFTGLGAAIASAFAAPAKAANIAPIGDLISDCREWQEGDDHQPHQVYVDGVRIHGCYYINFTKGFVRSWVTESGNDLREEELTIARTRFDRLDTHLTYKTAKEGHCFISKPFISPTGFVWPHQKWEEVPIPAGCELMALSEGHYALSKTIHGKIETRPIQSGQAKQERVK